MTDQNNDIKVDINEVIRIASTDKNLTGFRLLDSLAEKIHKRNVEAGWWDDFFKFEDSCPSAIPYFLSNKITLMHSEASEMMEGLRKGSPDDHLPHRSAEEVECADLLIRLLDYADARDFDLSGAVMEKLVYNGIRQDHKREVRESGEPGAKSF